MSEVFNVFDLSPEDREKFLASLDNPHGFNQKEPDAWWGGDVMIVDGRGCFCGCPIRTAYRVRKFIRDKAKKRAKAS